MSIAVTPPALAGNATYQALLAEVRYHLDDDLFSEQIILNAIRNAEALFRRELPFPGPDVEVRFTVIDDVAPDDVTTVDVSPPGLGYEGIPPISAATPTNWLLTGHRDLYLNGVLHYCYEGLRDDEAAARTLAKTSELILSVRSALLRQRYGRGPLVPYGFDQVRGARA